MNILTQPQQELYEWLVTYISQNHHAPSIRQMMEAMNLKSPAPVQSRLKHLQAKGYIEWIEGKARTIRIVTYPSGLPILGAIAAGGLVEPFTDTVEHIDLAAVFSSSSYFALRVTGDSMIENQIAEGDLVIMQPVKEAEKIKNGTIVAARVEGYGTTLKHLHKHGDRISLKPANSKYFSIEVMADQVQIQGTLVGVWRSYERTIHSSPLMTN